MIGRYRKAAIILLSFSRLTDAYSSVSLMLAKEFAKDRPVYFIDSPYTLSERITNRNKPDFPNHWKAGRDKWKVELPFAELPNFKLVLSPLLNPINFLPKGAIYNYFNDKNAKSMAIFLQEIVEKEQLKDYIFFNCFYPAYYPIIPTKQPPLVSIYQSVDVMSESKFLAKHVAEKERNWMKSVDLPLVTSLGLKAKWSDLNREVYVLPNAGDFSLFQKALEAQPRPADIKSFQNRIVGYIGNLDSNRIDFDLIGWSASQLPNHEFVFIGPIDAQADKIKQLSAQPNIHFLGARKMEELPAYLHHFDCCLIPFLKNKLTKGIYPLKINEYLSAGRQVVSTNFSIDIQSFEDDIHLATNKEQFVQAIREAVVANTKKNQKHLSEIGKKNSYANRVETFYEIIEKSIHNSTTEKLNYG